MTAPALASLAVHPACAWFPLLEGDGLRDLVADIREHGLLDPVVVQGDTLLDGRNRLRACGLAGVPVRYEEWTGQGDPTAWIVSHNLHRRHLDESQRSMLAARIEEHFRPAARERQREGGREKVPANLPEAGEAREHAARLANVSPRSVQNASRVLSRGVPELVAAVDAGEVAVSAAAEVVALPPDAQKEVVARGARAIIIAARTLRSEKQEGRRKERLAVLRATHAPYPLNALGRFRVLLADPPWRYEFAESESRTIENQYPTMSLTEIADLPVAGITENEAVLFLWATPPKLAEALVVLDAWGFTYRTCLVWVKDRIGMGYYARQRHEILLVGTRGSFPAPAPADRTDSVIEAPRGEHSEKPAKVYDLIEAMYPDLSRVELFARRERHGWASWGNQAGGAE